MPPRALLLRFQAILLARHHNLSYLQSPPFVRVQVKVFLQWCQVHLPFLRLLLVYASVGHYRLELHPPRGSYSLQFHFTCIASSLPSLEYSFASLKLEKAFIVGPGHAPIPSKLVSKIIGSQVVELADLLSANLQAVEQEPQMFLDGELLVSSSKHRQVEI